MWWWWWAPPLNSTNSICFMQMPSQLALKCSSCLCRPKLRCAWLWKFPNITGQNSVKAFPRELFAGSSAYEWVLFGKGEETFPELSCTVPVTHSTSPISPWDQQYLLNRQGQGQYYQQTCPVFGWLSLTWVSFPFLFFYLLCKGWLAGFWFLCFVLFCFLLPILLFKMFLLIYEGGNIFCKECLSHTV